MSRQSAEKWYTSQMRWHQGRWNWEYSALIITPGAADAMVWHAQERDWYSARLAALSVKGK